MPPPRRLRAVNDKPGRAVLYVRVSALMGRSGDDFHSPGMQLEHMRRTIGLAGLTETAVVQDLDRSGQNFSREGIAKIRAMVEAKKVDVIAVYDLSRLGRNLAESLTFIRWLRERDVSVMSAQERIDDSPEGQYMLGQFLGLAELFGLQVGRRWAQIVERRARLGKHHGVVPQGYQRIDKVLEVDPVLGPAVAAVFEAYARGDLVSEIMSNFESARGRPVRRGSIKDMLKNPVYRGRVAVKSSTGGELDLPGEHPPLVDDETWKRVQRRVEADRQSPPRVVEPKYSLTGLIWCAHCRRAAQVWYSAENGRTRRIVCSVSRQASSGCSGIGTPLYANVERYVFEMVADYLSVLRTRPGDHLARMARAHRAGVDKSTLEAELSATLTAMGRITERWGRGAMPDAAYAGAIGGLEETQIMLEKRIGELGDVEGSPDPGKIVSVVGELVRLWPELTDGERNRGLRGALKRVYIQRASRWREPIEDRIDINEVEWIF